MGAYMTVIDKAMLGYLRVEEVEGAIDDAVDDFHDSLPDCALHEWLGMTVHEYRRLVEDPSTIGDILSDRFFSDVVGAFGRKEET